MAITEPERALEIYEQALKRNPRDFALAAKMGKALQKTHQYVKALNYYKVKIRDPKTAFCNFLGCVNDLPIICTVLDGSLQISYILTFRKFTTKDYL